MQRDVFGNTLGLKQSQLQKLRHTYRRRVGRGEIVSPELARHLTELSQETHRQVGVLLDRKGDVEAVIVGDATRLELPEIGRARAGQVRLRGLRLVHTHLNGEPLTRDDLTDLALLRLDLVAAVAVLPDGLPGAVDWAHLVAENPKGELWHVERLRQVHDADVGVEGLLAGLEDEFSRAAAVRKTFGTERVILVGMSSQGRRAAEDSMSELKELARSAGVQILDAIVQGRRDVDPKYLIGRGKLQDLVLRSMQLMASMIIFDTDLSPSQARHIGEETSLKIIDRTQLILDIFAQRAQSADGKLQVELAQLKYLLPRLSARDDSLSRLTGGIGGRGPGETKLEIDKRRVRDRISWLEKKIERVASEREVRRRARNRNGLPIISIVGYTNAGKSTLL
ncbi:MAG: GTPase HflX, partial [Deltaproteobacteria bacterium]|nr:GTPase HflX [Deltaproteobacteria bacterium]